MFPVRNLSREEIKHFNQNGCHIYTFSATSPFSPPPTPPGAAIPQSEILEYCLHVIYFDKI